jgi:hypothetical protein
LACIGHVSAKWEMAKWLSKGKLQIERRVR